MFYGFHSFLVEVQANAGYICVKQCRSNLQIRIVGSSWCLVLTIISLSSDEPNPTPRCTLYFTVEEEQSFTEERSFIDRLEIVPWVCSTEKQIKEWVEVI